MRRKHAFGKHGSGMTRIYPCQATLGKAYWIAKHHTPGCGRVLHFWSAFYNGVDRSNYREHRRRRQTGGVPRFLFRRRRIHQTEQCCPPFISSKSSFLACADSICSGASTNCSRLDRLPAVRNQIRGNPEQPGGKRNPAPLELLQVGQSMMKNFGG